MPGMGGMSQGGMPAGTSMPNLGGQRGAGGMPAMGGAGSGGPIRGGAGPAMGLFPGPAGGGAFVPGGGQLPGGFGGFPFVPLNPGSGTPGPGVNEGAGAAAQPNDNKPRVVDGQPPQGGQPDVGAAQPGQQPAAPPPEGAKEPTPNDAKDPSGAKDAGNPPPRQPGSEVPAAGPPTTGGLPAPETPPAQPRSNKAIILVVTFLAVAAILGAAALLTFLSWGKGNEAEEEPEGPSPRKKPAAKRQQDTR